MVGGPWPGSTGVPAYFHPALRLGDWDVLARPDQRIRAVVLNIDNGPGVAPELALAAAADRALAAGMPVIGYTDTGYGTRPIGHIRTDMLAYTEWYGTVGFFFDQVSTGYGDLEFYRRVTDMAREFGGTVVLNHGAYPDPRYADLADVLVTFEGPWSAYGAVRAPGWARQLPAGRFWHLVYATPPAMLTAALSHAAECNVETAYITDRAGTNPWSGLPSYFAQHLAAVTAPAV